MVGTPRAAMIGTLSNLRARHEDCGGYTYVLAACAIGDDVLCVCVCVCDHTVDHDTCVKGALTVPPSRQWAAAEGAC